MTRSPRTLLLLPVLCALVGVQLWLFSWAPLHGHALDASLGFLLLPLAIVLGSRLVLRAEVTPMQWAAVCIAVLAVTIKFALTPQLSWVTAVVCLGYPAYFIARRRFGLDNPMAFGVEIAVIAPVALLLAWQGGPLPQDAVGRLALVVVGLAGAAAMAAFLAASQPPPNRSPGISASARCMRSADPVTRCASSAPCSPGRSSWSATA